MTLFTTPNIRAALALPAAVLLSVSITGAAAAQSTQRAVFVVNNVSDEITSYTMNADGTLNFVGFYATSDGPMAAALTPDGQYLAVTHGTADEYVEAFQVFQVNADASLTMVYDGLVPNSPMSTVWLNNEIVAITQTSLSGTNYARTYRFDPAVPSVTEVDAEPTGGFNTYLATHPFLDVLYAQDSTYNTVYWINFDADGNLTLGGTLGTGLYPLKLRPTHDGRFLYSPCGISGGGHNVLGFSINAGGALASLAGSPFYSPGQSPAYAACSSDDAFLFVGHGTDATVRSFTIHGETGAIISTGYMFDVGMQGTLGDVQVLGDWLLVTDESTAIDGIKGIYSFLINADGSFTAVAPIYDPGGTRPESIVTWDPPSANPADVNGDGVVDVLDLLAVIAAWGNPGGPEDVNGDGVVDVLDLLAVIAAWS